MPSGEVFKNTKTRILVEHNFSLFPFSSDAAVTITFKYDIGATLIFCLWSARKVFNSLSFRQATR